MKKKVILSSVLSIVLCLSLICGATFALFTDTETVNIAVTSGKVDVNASIELVAIRSRTMEWKEVTDSGTFETAGTATLNGNTLNLINIVPGDEAVCKITVTSDSNVDILYRTVLKSVNDTGLFEALKVSIGDDTNYDAESTTYKGYDGNEIGTTWKKLIADTTDVVTQYVKITFPYTGEDQNQYQDKTTGIAFTVEAVQGNAEIEEEYVSTVDELKAALTRGGKVILSGDMQLDGPLSVSSDVELDLNGYTLTGNGSYALNFTGGKSVLRNGTVQAAGSGKNVNCLWTEGDAVVDLYDVEMISGTTGTNTNFPIWTDGTSVLNIHSGTYTNANGGCVVYAGGDSVVSIYGGEFDSAENYISGYTWAMINDQDSGNATITIYGGAFAAFDPSDKNDDRTGDGPGNSDSFVADGYEVSSIVKNGLTWFYVFPEGTAIVDTDEALKSAMAISNGTVYLTAGEYTMESIAAGVSVIAEEGTVVVATDNSAVPTSLTDVTFKNITFSGDWAAAYYTYTHGDVVFDNCVFTATNAYGYHVDDAYNGTITFNGCTFNGFNAFASTGTYYFNDCTFTHNGNYGHTNMWGVGYFNNCTWGDGTSLSLGGSGIGTIYIDDVEESYYHKFIGSAENLIAFAESVNQKNNSWKNEAVILVNDIDLSGIDWEPVGQTGSTQFGGTFDGQGHTISNLTVDSSAETGAYYSSGLFGWVNGAIIKNVNVDTANVTGHHNVGVIAGYLETTGTTISNCHVTNATVSCTHYDGEACGDKAGVIVGHAGNSGVKVENCSATDSTVSAGRDGGQIVGAALTVNVVGCTAKNVTVTANGTCTDSSAGKNINETVIGRVL